MLPLRRTRMTFMATMLTAAYLTMSPSRGAEPPQPPAPPATRPATTFVITDYGARAGEVPADKDANTRAFRRAVEACGKAGGGVVRVPAGDFLVAPVDFVSGMTLHLDEGAVLRFSNDPADFPDVDSRWEGLMLRGHRPCLWAAGCRDVAITGSGTIEGQGKPWWDHTLAEKAAKAKKPGGTSGATAEPGTRKSYEPAGDGRAGDSHLRPPLVQFRDCTNVRVEGVTFRNAPFWTLHLLFSEDVTIRGAKFLNPQHAPNTDGIDIDSSRRVLIEDCHADVGDDAFCLKSGRDEDGRRVNRPTEDVTIRRCTVAHAHGGVVIGSETSGGIRRVHFEDCTFDGTDNGFRLKTMRGRGGVVEDVQAENIRIRNVDNAVLITMQYAKTPAEPVSERTPRVRDVHLKNITVRGAKHAGLVLGLEEMPVEDVTLTDLDVTAQNGFWCADGKGVEFRGVKIATEFGPALTQQRMRDLRVVDWQESKADDKPAGNPGGGPAVPAGDKAGPATAANAVLTSEFIYETAPYPSCHASTIAETKGGVVAAWFGGTRERAPDVGIWVARKVDGKWTTPVEVADGVQESGPRLPCWNPVLFQPKNGPVMLFYKIGPDPRSWWGMLRTSDDAGKTWSAARRLPDGILGPIKNKPVALPDGSILCPSSTEQLGAEPGWRLHFERTADLGRTWTTAAPPVDGDRGGKTAEGKPINAIQPSILFHPGGRLQAIGRTKEARLFQAWSEDGGTTWLPLSLTDLPNPNSGTDAVTLADGRHVLVYNHNPEPKGRTPLNVAVSKDGKMWQAALVLENEPGEYSYPALIQAADGLLHFTYTWKRQRIKHVVVDPTKMDLRDMPDGQWPAGTSRP